LQTAAEIVPEHFSAIRRRDFSYRLPVQKKTDIFQPLLLFDQGYYKSFMISMHQRKKKRFQHCGNMTVPCKIVMFRKSEDQLIISGMFWRNLQN